MNSSIKRQATRFLILALILPSALSFCVYYGFASNYTLRNVYSESGFREQYENGVFRYRILGRAAVMATYDLINRHHLPTMGPKALRVLDPEASDALYTACFFVNTVFMCLTCTVLFLVAEQCGAQQRWVADLSLLLMICLMALTQYVVVPYDLMSYFFLAVSMLATMKKPLTFGWTTVLCAAAVLCTLTRETALLILAFYAAINYRQFIEKPSSWRLNNVQKVFGLLLICLIVPAALLRVYYGTDHAVYQQINIARWIRFPPDVIGAVFFVSLLAVMLLSEPARNESIAFLIVASPYILGIFLFASPWETRLFCPIFLSLIVLKLRAIGRQDTVIQAV